MSFSAAARARFADLFGGHIFPQYAGKQGSLTCNDGAVWRRVVPFDYAIAHQLLARDMGRHVKIECRFYEDQKKVLTPSERLLDSDERVQAAKITICGTGFKSEIFLNLTDKIGFASLIEVDPAYQEHGLGKHLMRNQIEFIYGLGMKSVHMRAAMSAGGYAWGKFGLEPTDLRTDQIFKDIVQKRFGAIRPLLSREEIRELAPLTILSCREDVWALSQSSIELGPRLIDVFDEARGLKELKRSFTESVYDRIKARAQEGLSVPAGQYHLAGTQWRGHVTLSDRSQLRRIAAYSGGFSGQVAGLNPCGQ